MTKTVLLTGGSGLVGRHLSRKLNEKGYVVTNLSRTKKNDNCTFYWNPEKRILDNNAIKNVNAIIHLAGASIGESRWTALRKEEIIQSRIATTRFLMDSVKEFNSNLSCFIAASGVGYYGTSHPTKVYTEDDDAGNDFLANVCVVWEKETEKFKDLGIRTVILRTGLVLAKDALALQKIAFPVKMGIGSPIGSGNQPMPWIHIDDLCELYIQAMENSQFSGIYNAVSPETPSNSKFIKTLAAVLKKPFIPIGVPEFLLKVMLGELADLVLKGSNISSEKIISTGFEHKYPYLYQALENLLKKD